MGKPFVLINSAMTADGKISNRKKNQVLISSKNDLNRVNRLRNEFDAIMVGVGTVLCDNPNLEGENLIKVVPDSRARTPINSNLFGEEKTILAVTEEAEEKKLVKLREKADVLVYKGKKVDLERLLSDLSQLGIKKLLVEGGGTINWSLFKKGLVDEVSTYIGNFILGGKNAPTLVDGEGFLNRKEGVNLDLKKIEKMDEGVLLNWKVDF